MARLGEQLGEWLSRVELLARGAEWHRVEAERSLAAGRPWDARAHALTILDELPRSRVALALWADAAEAALLDHEVVEALALLVTQLPFRADVWLRLAQARTRLGQDPLTDLSRAAELTEPASAADAARLLLLDRDLSRNDVERAERWLEQLSLAGRASQEAALRRLELGLARADAERARSTAAALEAPALADARGWLARARLNALSGDADPTPAFARALLLEAPGALSAAAAFVASAADAGARARLGALVADLGADTHPIWRAAFASAEGRSGEALSALAEGARQSPDRELAERYLNAAIAARDAEALAEALVLTGPERHPGVAALLDALGQEHDAARLDAVDRVHGPGSAWAESLRHEVFERWCGAGRSVAWRELLAELNRSARALGELDAVRDIEGIARDLDRPLRVAIVGEFNAGKSSLINALLGEDVAPVGVLPTTATQNHLAWAPDRFARVELSEGRPDRVVPHALLRATLSEIETSHVARVSLFAPLELLRKVELVDTPGFNAPDAAHAQRARAAFADAHLAIWLLDASQPLKESERRVLEEIAGTGLPLCVLMNKIDRLPSPSALDQARAHVETGLAAAGIAAEAPVVAFSARLALAGRSGDEAARIASRWEEVERLVDSVLVERSELLRERALRRWAAGVARRFGERAARERREQGLRSQAQRRQRERLAQLEARAVAERAEWERGAGAAFAEPVRAFCQQVSPVAGMVDDDGARRFVERRAREALAPELARCLCAPLELDAADARLLAAELSPRLEALAAARAVSSLSAVRVAEGGRKTAAGAGVTSVVENLAALAVDELGRALALARGRVQIERESPVVGRVLALAAVLTA